MQNRDIFIDTGAFFALQAVDDAHHQEASRAFPQILRRYNRLFTSNMIISETYTLLRITKGFNAAWSFLKIIDGSDRLKIIFSGSNLENETRKLLHTCEDHPFSFADALSFVIMKKEKIDHAFAFNNHFAAAGFVRIPGDLELS